MQNLKIRVNNEAESREVQELFFKLGYEWQSGDAKYLNCGLDVFYILPRENGEMSYCDVAEVDFNSKNNGYSFFKTITLPELRDLVVLKRNDKNDRNVIDPEYDDANLYLDSKSDLFVFHLPTQTWKESNLNNESEVLARLQPIEKNMKEYLMPSRNYEYILTDAREALEPHAEDWIAIPKGAEALTKEILDSEEMLLWWRDNFNKCIGHDDQLSNYEIDVHNHLERNPKPVILWQREQDEPFLTPECTLNDQYAEIEQARQVEIHGTVKAAQASGGVDATLTERQSQYGCYEDVAHVTQQILSSLRIGNYDELPAPMKESLHMIASKMARIVNGDPEYLDNWHDIGGYAKLIEKLIKGE